MTLLGAAHRFGPGHRIRLQVSGGAFPRFARNPGTGQVDGPAAAMRPTRYRIGLGTASALLTARLTWAGRSSAPEEREPARYDWVSCWSAHGGPRGQPRVGERLPAFQPVQVARVGCEPPPNSAASPT